MQKIFDVDTINITEFNDKIKAKEKSIKISTLGGKDRASIMLSLSLDKRKNWYYSIFENSRYYRFDININGTVENFSRGHDTNKIRKKRSKILMMQ